VELQATMRGRFWMISFAMRSMKSVDLRRNVHSTSVIDRLSTGDRMNRSMYSSFLPT
jgi:hypothetical protein